MRGATFFALRALASALLVAVSLQESAPVEFEVRVLANEGFLIPPGELEAVTNRLTASHPDVLVPQRALELFRSRNVVE